MVAAGGLASDKGEWRIVLEFLRDTDPVLLQRISRKLINHLSWCGIHEAKDLLLRGAPVMADISAADDENRPLRRNVALKSVDVTAEAFGIASQHLSETEILSCVTTWIKEESVASWCERWKIWLRRWEKSSRRSSVISMPPLKRASYRFRPKRSAGIADPPVLLREPGVHQHRQELHRGQRLLRSAGEDHLPAWLSRKAWRQERRAVPRQKDHREDPGGECTSPPGKGTAHLVPHLGLDSELRPSQ